MPSRKIISILIVCVGAILSVWLFSSGTKFAGKFGSKSSENSAITVATSTARLYDENDWKKILTNINPETSTSTTRENSLVYPNEGTQTDQMARDFFSQYLSAKRGGAPLTADQAIKIAENTLASGDYTKAVGVQYTFRDLHISSKSDKETALIYGNAVSQSFINRKPKNVESVAVIIERAVRNERESELAQLDPIISSLRGVLSDMLNMTIPSDAVVPHLDFIIALSNVLANTEAMRQAFTDPVRSFAALSMYDEHTQDLAVAINNLNKYFTSKK